jgi:hypothetical protein
MGSSGTASPLRISASLPVLPGSGGCEVDPALRRWPTLSDDQRLGCWVGVALFAYYLLTLGGHHYSIDGIVMFESAKQLFFRHSFVLDPPVKWAAEVIYVNHLSMGLMLAYLPALALVSPLFYRIPSLQLTPYDPAVPYNRELYSNLPYLLCSWVNPLVTALTGMLVFAIARRLGLTRGWAVAAALAYGLASPATVYARFDFSQPLAGLALTAAVWGLIETRGGGRLGPLLLAGAGLSVTIATRAELSVLIAWISVWLLVHARAGGRRTAVTAVCVVATAVIAAVAFHFWLNHLRFGDWSRTGYAAPTVLFTAAGAPQRALGLLLSPGRGVLLFFPLAWLAVPGLVRLVRERQAAGSLFSGLMVFGLALYASYRVWWGGWNWGPRFLLPLLPLLSLAATFWAFRGGRARATFFAGLAALGFVIAWNGMLFDFVLYYHWVQTTMGLNDTAATHFRWAASPLVSGWRFLPTTSVDLLLLKMGKFGGPGTVAAVLVASPLLAALAWSGLRIRAELREPGRVTSPRGDERPRPRRGARTRRPRRARRRSDS